MELPQLLTYLARNTWPVMEGRYVRDCCIASSRIAMAVLEYFGHQSREIQVMTTVINPVMYGMMGEFLKSGKLNPREDKAHLDALEAAGAFQVIIGHPKAGDDPNKIGAHLIVEVDGPTEKFYLDTSIGQASRPEKDIHLPNGVWFYESLWKNGGAMMRNEAGTYLLYARHPKPDPNYKSSPDWKSDRHSRFAGKLIRGARELAA